MWTQENIPDQRGKSAIVTGANSGIGFQTALALYQAGATVIVVSRTGSNARKAIEQMKSVGGKGSLEPGVADLSDLDSIRAFAQEIVSRHQKLDILINNAGVMIPPPSLTKDGFEMQFGVNFIGHFALTAVLYPLLRKTSHSRIVTLTSLAYTLGTIDFDNFRLEKEYDASREYGQSKLADMLFTIELQRRIKASGDTVISVAAHPGVSQTGLARNMSKEVFDNAVKTYGELMPASQGALSSLYAAVHPDIEPGRLYGPDEDGGLRGYPAQAVIQPAALETSIAKGLWRTAEAAAHLKFL